MVIAGIITGGQTGIPFLDNVLAPLTEADGGPAPDFGQTGPDTSGSAGPELPGMSQGEVLMAMDTPVTPPPAATPRITSVPTRSLSRYTSDSGKKSSGTTPVIPIPSPTPAPAAPAVTSVSPALGPIAGGTAVTVTGTGFTGATGVTFGSTAAASFTVTDDSHIAATSPAGTAGTIDITVTTPGGTSATSAADQFTYCPVPAVTVISPALGPIAGGTAVTITGTGFTSATGVTFGSTAAASFTVTDDSHIAATSPAGTAGTVDITVATPGGTSATSAADQFTYCPVPVVTSVTPAAGPIAGGTAVTITGTGFTSATGVTFGSTAAASFTVTDDSHIAATSPAGTAGTIDITVTTPGGTSATSAADQFTYCPVPAVTVISPALGPIAGGTAVTITGTGFTSATGVTFGSTAAASFTVTDDSHIAATSPAGTAGTVDITVTTPGGTSATSAADQFTYYTVPTVTGISPSYGWLAGGDTVTVTGTGFTVVSAVSFGATVPAASYTVIDTTHLSAVTPAYPFGAGSVHIYVTNPAGTSASAAANEFIFIDAPTITAVSPAAGPVAGSTAVTITGMGFSGATSVKFGSTDASSFNVVSDTQITATSPAHAAGIVDITVTSPAGTSATSAADQYIFMNVPGVSGISPASGTSAGGTTVSISGTDLIGTTGVYFGSTPAASFAVATATSMTAVSPPGVPGSTVDITVVSPGGTSPTSAADQFTYV